MLWILLKVRHAPLNKTQTSNSESTSETGLVIKCLFAAPMLATLMRIVRFNVTSLVPKMLIIQKLHTFQHAKEFETRLDPRLLGLSCLRQWQWFRRYAVFQGLDFTTTLPLLLTAQIQATPPGLPHYTPSPSYIGIQIIQLHIIVTSDKYLKIYIVVNTFSAFSLSSLLNDHVPGILHAAVIALLPGQTLSCKLCAELLDVQVAQPCQSNDAMLR